MSAYLLYGLLAGSCCLIIHISLLAYAKQPPVLSQAIELFLASVGASGGIKTCHFVISGKLAAAFQTASLPLSEEDQIYFLVGAFSLIWLSVDTITRSLWKAFKLSRRRKE